jgi:hypothetical protein
MSITRLDQVGIIRHVFYILEFLALSLGPNTDNAEAFLSFPQSLPPNVQTGSPYTSFPNFLQITCHSTLCSLTH